MWGPGQGMDPRTPQNVRRMPGDCIYSDTLRKIFAFSISLFTASSIASRSSKLMPSSSQHGRGSFSG